MNIFRLTGDLSHLLAIIILLRKIWKTRSCAVRPLPLFVEEFSDSKQLKTAENQSENNKQHSDNTANKILVVKEPNDAAREHSETPKQLGAMSDDQLQQIEKFLQVLEGDVVNDEGKSKTLRTSLPKVHCCVTANSVEAQSSTTNNVCNDKSLSSNKQLPPSYNVPSLRKNELLPLPASPESYIAVANRLAYYAGITRLPPGHLGISGKSQILFAVVYTTRYLDLVTTFVSTYNTLMKLVFIAASYATIYMIYIKFKATYDHNHDTFRIEFLLLPALVLALLINHDFTVLEVLWTFSIYLESVAILPQLFMVSKTGEAESITSHYLFALGSYRGLYILNWIYRYYTESHYDLIAIVAGVVQTVLYCDFFYLYITKVLRGKKLQLPA